jgi:magnesium chelatase family protein
MTIHVLSGCLHGVTATPVGVEVDVLSMLPSFQIVGLPASSVREARERVRSAIDSSELPYPRRRITVNLAPADRPKQGTGLDLPIALGVIAAGVAADGGEPWKTAPAAVGELGLDGSVRPIRGALPILEAVARMGARRAIVAKGNAPEARLVPGLEIVAVDHLVDAWNVVTGREEGSVPGNDDLVGRAFEPSHHHPPPREPDLADVRGLEAGRRAMEVAAAGGHGVLLEGPPGSGKSMLARRLASLLPDLPDSSALEVTRIRSASGLLAAGGGLLQRPPLRSPHHSASVAAIVGGGRPLNAGEVTLAHRGVLMLDEAPEFSRGLLESLRQPLEDRFVTIARAESAHRFPADFQLVATRNPCPCGLRGATVGPRCRCGDAELDKYQRRLSGPILDRIDLRAWIPPTPADRLLDPNPGESSAAVRGRVAAARARAFHRAEQLGFESPAPVNAQIPAQPLLTSFDSGAVEELGAGFARTRGSARSVQQLVRVARTIADLAETAYVSRTHVQEALFLCIGREFDAVSAAL